LERVVNLFLTTSEKVVIINSMKRFISNKSASRATGCTVKSVAQRAGVSIGTVSRVLNNHPKVSEGNKRAVERAMAELNYRPDPVARSLRRHGSGEHIWTGNIGLVFPNTTTAMMEVPFMAKMIQGAQNELSDHGYHLLISNTTDPVSLPDIVRDGKVEGVLIHGDLKLELCEKLATAIPAVSMGQNNVHLPLAMVNVNNRSAIITAMRYLYGLGHRRIGFVTREPEHKDISERLYGYREAFSVLELTYDSRLESVGIELGNEGPRFPEKVPPNMDSLVGPLLDLREPPTALVVPGDWQAIGVYRYLQSKGIRIPQDISVIGFDNAEQICCSLSPALTSLEYPSEEIGRQAARLLLRQVKEKKNVVQETILIPSTLVERESAGRIVDC